MPRFPARRDQRDVAGRHYLTKAEINALYFATHKMGRPRGWDAPHPISRYRRAALVVFFYYGVDWNRLEVNAGPRTDPLAPCELGSEIAGPRGEGAIALGGLFYRRVKTDKAFYRSMNRVVHARILGHSVGGITYRRYAHRATQAFRAIMTLPQPSGFSAILRAGDSECPGCRRRFADTG